VITTHSNTGNKKRIHFIKKKVTYRTFNVIVWREVNSGLTFLITPFYYLHFFGQYVFRDRNPSFFYVMWVEGVVGLCVVSETKDRLMFQIKQ